MGRYLNFIAQLIVIAATVVLFLAWPKAHAQAPDPTKPITHLVIEIMGDDLKAARPVVQQWWNDEGACKISVRELMKRFVGQRKFVCVHVLGEDV